MATGSQGEWGAALHRLMNQSRSVTLDLEHGHLVKTIPGNEASVTRLIEVFGREAFGGLGG